MNASATHEQVEPVSEELDFTVDPVEAAGVRRYRLLAVILILAAVGLVGAARLTDDRDARLVDVNSAAIPSSVPPALAGVPVGHEVAREEAITYSPGGWRPWEATEGLHHVTVVAGTLTVHDESGFRRDYRVGESYLAGWSAYTTRNLTPEAAEATVQFLRPAARAEGGPAPND
ncbi:MAG: hypothetical protein M3163_08285 [Actinomycetota bacterium]|nr:hypothetical protein [Actinomycetota bacterium]